MHHVVEGNVSSENVHFERLWSRYTINPSQQTVKQIEFVQEVVLPKVSMLIASVMKINNEFFPGKRPLLKKINGVIKQLNGFITIFVVITNNITPINESRYKLINSSIHQKKFSFYSKY